jgi:hypothetical protein
MTQNVELVSNAGHGPIVREVFPEVPRVEYEITDVGRDPATPYGRTGRLGKGRPGAGQGSAVQIRRTIGFNRRKFENNSLQIPRGGPTDLSVNASLRPAACRNQVEMSLFVQI